MTAGKEEIRIHKESYSRHDENDKKEEDEMKKSFKSLVFKSPLSDLRFKMFKKWKENLIFLLFLLVFEKSENFILRKNAFFVILKSSKEKLQNE